MSGKKPHGEVTVEVRLPDESPDRNGNVYSKEAMEKALKEYQEKLESSGGSAEFLNRAFEVCRIAPQEDGKVTADIAFLDTPKGRSLSTLYETGFVGFSVSGSVDPDGKVEIDGFNPVLDPTPREPLPPRNETLESSVAKRVSIQASAEELEGLISRALMHDMRLHTPSALAKCRRQAKDIVEAIFERYGV